MATVALISQKGGTGKSTLALALAWEAASRGGEVLAVDADAQGTLLEALGMAAERGLCPPTVTAMGRGMHSKEQLPRLARRFRHVFIDTPGRSDDVQVSALLTADVAIIPCGQFAGDVWALRAAVETLKRAQTLRPKLRGALVMSRVMPRTTLGQALRGCLGDVGLPVLRTVVTHRTAWGESIGAGVGVAQYAPRDRAAEEARALASEVFSLVGRSTR